MQTQQAMHTLRTKKYWQKLALTLSVAVILTVLVTSEIVNIPQANNSVSQNMYSPGAYTQEALTGPIILNRQGMFLSAFNVPEEAKDATLWGNYSVAQNGPYNYTATMIIWSQQEFLNYFSGKNAVPCYNRDMFGMQSDNLNVTLTKGNYIVTIEGNIFNTNVLEANLLLNFTVT